MTKELAQVSVKEYAKSIGITRQAVLHRINKRLELPKVSSVKKVGRAYILTIVHT